MNSNDAYLFCKYVENTHEMRNRITDSWDAYRFCSHIENTQEMRDKITDSDDKKLLNELIKDKEL